jgi:hypothetical protein
MLYPMSVIKCMKYLTFFVYELLQCIVSTSSRVDLLYMYCVMGFTDRISRQVLHYESNNVFRNVFSGFLRSSFRVLFFSSEIVQVDWNPNRLFAHTRVV